MRVFFTTLFSFCFLLTYAQQVPRQKVILEVGTGTWSPSCPKVVDIIENLELDGAELAVIAYHGNDSYTNEASESRSEFYDIPWYPSSYIDAQLIPYNQWDQYDCYKDLYNNRIQELSSFYLESDLEIHGDVLSGSIEVNKVAEYEGQNLRLYMVLTESHVTEYWEGEFEVNHTERMMYPSAEGTVIDAAVESSLLDFVIILDPSLEQENLEIIYFVQDVDTKEILQGDSIKLEEYILSNGDEIAENRSAYFYPNPVQKELYLAAENPDVIENIIITDSNGKNIIVQPSYKGPIDVLGLSQGVYILSYYENNVKKVSKIVRQ